MALSIVGFTNVASSAAAQTTLLPDRTMRDPRMTVIRERLQSDHGSVRPLTVQIDTNFTWSDQRLVFSTFENLLLEAGAEPVSSRRDAQFQLYLEGKGRLDSRSGLIVDTFTLKLTDLKAGGGQLIMSSTSVLQCPDTRKFKYQDPSCPFDQGILTETFLRLR
jgi:hypothetical protein